MDKSPQDGPAIIVEDLVKTYGKQRALDGLSFTGEQGQVLGVLGPNGAGKTTAVRILSTLLSADSGRASVCGVDVAKHPQRVRKLIGLTGQYAAVDEFLTGWENLEMMGRLFRMPAKAARARADELLERFELVDAGKRAVKTYSGGMRRRLDIAASLVARPQVMFLDEPTTGLDPHSRIEMWKVISELVADGTTMLLTTQYLEEADQLANQIIVIDHGRLIASGTATELKASVGGERLEVVVGGAAEVQAARGALHHITGEEPIVDEEAASLRVPVRGGATILPAVIRALDDAEVTLKDLAITRPTLDDVFLTLTGHAAEADSTSDASEGAQQ
ncbi:MAG: ATP-binding cassette domain-containing protein [Corynebacteriales bacterium]|nr:ATP-binding cassette domain-containing protein [Mycobacteriales bacterium]